VGVAAVGLDHQTAVAPEEVGPVRADRDLGLWDRKAAGAELEEGGLELAVGCGGDVRVEEPAQAGVAGRGAWKVIEGDAELCEVEPVNPLRLAQCGLELASRRGWRRGRSECVGGL
jgi:hypothetical protein